METHPNAHGAPEEKASFKDTALRTIAVLGLIAVLLLGAWGIIQLAVALPNIFGGIGDSVASIFTTTPGSQKESLTVTVPATSTSGQSLTVAWAHKNTNGAYSYSISYSCQSGLSLKAPLPTGAYQTVACNKAFNFVNASEHMIVIPTVSGGKTVPLTLTVSATQLASGLVTATGSGVVQIAPAGTTAPTGSNTTAPKPTTSATGTTPSATYYPAPKPLTLYGISDLVVRPINVVPQGNGLTAVQFSIENDGTNIAAGGWTFNAQLPIDGGYTFASQPQRALYPGDKVVYTLTFSGGYSSNYSNNYNNGYGYTGSAYYSGASGYTCSGYVPCTPPSNYNYNYGYQNQNGIVTITVDPYNMIPEYNKANNTITIPVYGY